MGQLCTCSCTLFARRSEGLSRPVACHPGEPRLAVEQPDGLVAVAMKRSAEMFEADTRSSFLTGWSLLLAGRCSRQEFFVDFGDDDVVGVDHFVQMDFGSFREQLVGIHFR